MVASQCQVSSKHADAFLAALATVIEVPEMRTMSQKVQAFAQEKKNQMAANDLVHLMSVPVGTRVDCRKVSACLKATAWHDRANALLAPFLTVMITDLIAKVAQSQSECRFPSVFQFPNMRGVESAYTVCFMHLRSLSSSPSSRRSKKT